MIKEERKRKRRRRAFLLCILILLFLLSAAFFVVVEFFTVEHVEVEGNVLYEDEVISSVVLDDPYAWNTLYVYLKYKFTKTENVPFIDTVNVKLKGPHTLSVDVYEKGMMGYLYIPGIRQYAYFDKDGFVVETSTYVIADVPKIEGISCDEVILYENLPIKKALLRDILTLTQALKRSGWIPDSIIYGHEDSPIAVYGEIQVHLGSIELLTQKVERLDKIMPSLEGESGILHLENWTEETRNIVFDKTD